MYQIYKHAFSIGTKTLDVHCEYFKAEEGWSSSSSHGLCPKVEIRGMCRGREGPGCLQSLHLSHLSIHSTRGEHRRRRRCWRQRGTFLMQAAGATPTHHRRVIRDNGTFMQNLHRCCHRRPLPLDLGTGSPFDCESDRKKFP